MNGKQFIITTLFAVVLLTLVFAPLARQQGGGTYDPWSDLDDNGVIDVSDLAKLAGSYGTSGEPYGGKASIEYDSGWLNITDKCGQYFNVTHNLNSMDVVVEIQGKVTIDGVATQRYLGGSTVYTPGWTSTYGGSGWDVLESAVRTSDGGYAFAGYTYSYGIGTPSCSNLWLLKTGADGAATFNKYYGGTNNDVAYSVVQASDGGYVLAGSTQSFGAGGDDAWLIKFNPIGNPQQSRVYGGTNNDVAYSVVQTNDGGYALAGYTGSFGAGGMDAWLVKTDAIHNMQWNKTYGGTNDDQVHSVVQTSDGGYALAGYTYSYGVGAPSYANVYLVKTFADGTVAWNRTYEGTGSDYGECVVQTSDGGYALAGYTGSFGAGGMDAWLIKTDANGLMQWNKTYGGIYNDDAYSVVQTSDGGYALAGDTRSFGAGGYDFWLVRTDTNGIMQWNYTYGGILNEAAYSVVQASEGGYVLAGDTDSFGAGGDAWLVKTDAESGFSWTGSTPNTIMLYRGATDPYWNFVRVRIWKVKETP